MKVTVIREPKLSMGDVKAEVNSLSDIPALLFSCSEHYGGGTYTGIIEDEGDMSGPAYRLSVEWLDGNE